MKKSNQLLSIFTLITLFFFLGTSDVSAQTSKAENGTGATFGVETIYPSDQRNGENGYFDLRVEPNEKRKLELVVKNYGKKETTIEVELNRATTSDGGTTSYRKEKKKKDSSLKVDFEEIAHINEHEIHLKAQEQKKIQVELTMPEQTFEGQVLGGIRFKEKGADTPKNSGKTIVNTFSYSVAVLLTENDRPVENKLSLVKVYPAQRNYRNYIEATIQNSASTMIKNLNIDAKIYKEKNNKLVYQSKNDLFRMAPNSSFNYGVDLQNTELVNGKYRMVMKVDADGKSYDFDQTFEISKKDAKHFNDQAVFLDKEDHTLLYIGIGIAILLLIVAIIIVIFIKRRKKRIRKKKQQKKRKVKSKKNKKQLND